MEKNNEFENENEEIKKDNAASQSNKEDNVKDESDVKSDCNKNSENNHNALLSERRQRRNKDKSKKKHTAAYLATAAVIVAAIVGFGIYVNGYDKIMPHTYIEDISIGGMTQEEAISILSDEYSEDKLEGKTINFACMGDNSLIEVKNLAMQFKPAQMASDAYSLGRERSGFWHKFKEYIISLFNKRKIKPALEYDTQALTGAINDICSPHEKEPLGYTYSVADSSNIIIAKPQDGVKIDMDEAVQTVEHEICTFNFGDVEFIPEIAKAPKLDLDEFYSYITAPATDAYYAKDENNHVYVVPGKPQIVVNKSDIEAAVNQPLSEYTVPVQIVDSAVTTEFLQSILYEDTLGTYSTNYGGSSAARASNIKKASSTINGLELLPGERFDFNKVVGERKASTGYLQAPVYIIKNGETVSEMDYGGGICQVSSTIYCAVSRAKLRVITRVSHSKDVSYVPKGMDATVSWGGPDFVFENNTDYPIRILLEANGGILTARIVGAVAQKPNVTLDVQNDGKSVTVTKVTTNSDGSQTSEVISSKKE